MTHLPPNRRRADTGDSLNLPSTKESTERSQTTLRVISQARPKGYVRMRNMHRFVLSKYVDMQDRKKLRRMSTAEKLVSYTTLFLDPEFKRKCQEIQWFPGLPANIDIQRAFMFQRFYNDELAFSNMMQATINRYINPLKAYYSCGSSLMEWEDIIDIFSNIEDIAGVSSRLLHELRLNIPVEVLEDTEERLKHSSSKLVSYAHEFAMAFVSIGSMLEVYSLYVSNFKKALSSLRDLIRSSPKLSEFMQATYQLVGMRITQVLALPLIRMEQYSLALKDLFGTFEADKNNWKSSNAVYNAHLGISQTLRKTISPSMNLEARYAVAYIQENLFGGSIDLVTDTRYFIRAGFLSKVWNKQTLKVRKEKKYMFFLFNDILLYSTCSHDRYKLKHILSLVDMRVQELEDDPRNSKFRFRIESCGNQKSFQVSLESLNAKYSWMAAIQTCAARASKEFSKAYIKPEDVEQIITKPRKVGRTRLKHNWMEVKNENGLWYFYRKRSGKCSLAHISDKKSTGQDEENCDNIPHLLSSIRFRECDEPNCEEQALMLSPIHYCALHQPAPDIKSLLPGAGGDDYNDSFFFDDQLPISITTPEEARRRLSSIPCEASRYSSTPAKAGSPLKIVKNASSAMSEVIRQAPMRLERVDTYKPGFGSPMSKTSSSETDAKLLPDSDSDEDDDTDELGPIPNSVVSEFPWKKLWSDEYKQNYYWNSKTGKTTWERPPDFEEMQ